MFGVETLTNRDIIISVMIVTAIVMTAVYAFVENSKITDEFEESIGVSRSEKSKKTIASKAVFFFGLLGVVLFKELATKTPTNQGLVVALLMLVVAVTMIIRYREKKAISGSKNVDI